MKNDKIVKPRLIIHGGAGKLEGTSDRQEQIEQSLKAICQSSYSILLEEGAREAVLHAIRLLEDDSLFNAGTGSRLQADGKIRMSASLMDSSTGIFSAVINVQNIRHPIDIADMLSRERHTVLAGKIATEFCRNRGVELHDPTTELRIAEYENRSKGNHGTVGAVALDKGGRIVSGNSTGGIGYEIPGRVSDTATVAGNYASSLAGVSCTGIGEEIVNDAVAARIVIRVEDGMSLNEAVQKTINEAKQSQKRYGLIAIDHNSNIGYGYATEGMYYAYHDGSGITSFVNEMEFK